MGTPRGARHPKVVGSSKKAELRDLQRQCLAHCIYGAFAQAWVSHWPEPPQCPAAHKTAIFRQVNVDCLHAHHDALEFPDGDILLLTYLMEGQEAVVLQLPATGSKAPQRAAYV